MFLVANRITSELGNMKIEDFFVALEQNACPQSIPNEFRATDLIGK
jgi:hypothetical protein